MEGFATPRDGRLGNQPPVSVGGILALDIATVLGWARGEDGAPAAPLPLDASGGARAPVHEHGSEVLGQPGERTAVVLANFWRWLDHQLVARRPVAVIFESPFVDPKRMTIDIVRRLIGLSAMCEALCELHGVPCYEESNSRIKKHAVGRGRNVEKSDMIAAAEAVGWLPLDSHAADALWLLDLFLFHRGRKK